MRSEHHPAKIFGGLLWACIMGALFAGCIISGLTFMHKMQAIVDGISK